MKNSLEAFGMTQNGGDSDVESTGTITCITSPTMKIPPMPSLL